MREPFIPYGRQDVDAVDASAVQTVMGGRWLTTGPAVEEFEEKLQLWTGGSSVVAVSSGTAALHAAYFAAGLSAGDEVITPPITFVATQAAAVALGATIVFADVCEDTANIDPAAVESAITARTRAIVAVDYAGHPADMDELRAVADKHGLLLIEDAAHSLGSRYRTRPVGSLADITAFSFFATKNITTAEGGAVASRDPELLSRARMFSRQGLEREQSKHVMQDEGPWHQEAPFFGLNYRLPDILAVLGSSQLDRLADFKLKRAKVKALYDSALAAINEFVCPTQRTYVDPMWHLYPLRVPAGLRRQIFESSRNKGIGVQVNYLPAYWHPAFDPEKYPRGLCPVAEHFYAQELSLPMHTRLHQTDQERVIEVLIKALSER